MAPGGPCLPGPGAAGTPHRLCFLRPRASRWGTARMRTVLRGAALDRGELPPMWPAPVGTTPHRSGLRPVPARATGLRDTHCAAALRVSRRCRDQGAEVSAQTALPAGICNAAAPSRPATARRHRRNAAGAAALAPSIAAGVQSGDGTLSPVEAGAARAGSAPGGAHPEHTLPVRTRCEREAFESARGLSHSLEYRPLPCAHCRRCRDHRRNGRGAGGNATRRRCPPGQRARDSARV